MFGLVVLLLIVVPVVELYVLFQVAEPLGWLPTIGLLLLISAVGASLMKWQTSGQIGRIRDTIAQGQMPSKELADGALMIFGGSLLLTPGFFTDAVGLAMFIPPLRAIARRMLLKRFRGSVAVSGTPGGFAFGTNFGAGNFGADGARRSTHADDSIIDVDEVIIDRIPNTELPIDE